MGASFDLAELARSIEAERGRQGLTWAGLSREVGVSVSTIRRLATASDAEADGVLALVGWLGVAPEDFVANGEVDGKPLPPADGGMIRADMDLITSLPQWPGEPGARSRTTIQQLVEVAARSGRTVASLTRWSAT